MFAFDKAALPQLTTRKALIAVDFQNDFVSADGALPASEPAGFIARTAELAAAFRPAGDVIWVQSRFDAIRPADADQIVSTDAPLAPPKISRGRRQPASVVEPAAGPPDPEAFLSHEKPTCLQTESGREMPPQIQAAVAKGDTTLVKSNYSAFNGTQLLLLLRAKMVMEVVICGSLANVGVYATAMDAAGHGMAITVVEDCSGYRRDTRQARAVANLIELTGCEIASCREVLESLKPAKPKVAPPRPKGAAAKQPPAAVAGPSTPRKAQRVTLSPDIVNPMTGLRLASDSPAPALAVATAAKAESRTLGEAEADSHGRSALPKVEEAVGTKPKNADIKGKGKEIESYEHTVIKEKEPVAVANAGENKGDIAPSSDVSSAPTKPPSPMSIMDNADAPPASDSRDDHASIKQKGLCEGDTDIFENVLPADLAAIAFNELRDEVRWQRMSHQGGEVPRLVAVQGAVDEDGSMPIYRHPADESPPLLPFSPTVLAIKAETERHLGHALNHVLIQFYRDGKDYISEHSDKTLDIVRGSYIANVSLGAERTMVFRTKRKDKEPAAKKDTPEESAPTQVESTPSPGTSSPLSPRQSQRAQLPDNSLCRMGLKTNMKWLHSIRQDKRAEREKTAAELAYEGGRISLTFRQIGTFLNADETKIWGQGAKSKDKESAGVVINGQSPEAIDMLRAFGTENHASAFDWEAHYGKGFDVLHITNSPRLFASGDSVANTRVRLMLAELGIGYAKGQMTPAPENTAGAAESEAARIKLVDNDSDRSTVQGDMAIMLYLDAIQTHKQADKQPPSQPDLARRFTLFQRALGLHDDALRLRNKDAEQKEKEEKIATTSPKALKGLLAPWDAQVAGKGPFIGGEEPSIADFALWPALHRIVEEHDGAEVLDGLDNLHKYYNLFRQRESVLKVLGSPADKS